MRRVIAGLISLELGVNNEKPLSARRSGKYAHGRLSTIDCAKLGITQCASKRSVARLVLPRSFSHSLLRKVLNVKTSRLLARQPYPLRPTSLPTPA